MKLRLISADLHLSRKYHQVHWILKPKHIQAYMCECVSVWFVKMLFFRLNLVIVHSSTINFQLESGNIGLCRFIRKHSAHFTSYFERSELFDCCYYRSGRVRNEFKPFELCVCVSHLKWCLNVTPDMTCGHNWKYTRLWWN